MATPFDMAGRRELHERAADFCRYATAMALAKGRLVDTKNIFENRWPRSRHIDLITRAAADPGMASADGSPANWGSSLATPQALASAFVEFLRPQTVLGRMTGFRPVPFNVTFPRQTGVAAVGWVSESGVTPVGEMSFETDTFGISKIGGIVVFTKELAQYSRPAAEALIQRDLLAAVAAFQDQAFLDPDADGGGAGPASISYAAAEIVSSGNDASHVEIDLMQLVSAISTNRSALYFVMRPDTALSLATLRTGDVRTFPDVGMTGGSIWGVPVITSNNVLPSDTSPSLNRIYLIDASEILVAEGDVELDASGQATLDMAGSTSPNFSLWQRDCVGVKIVRAIRWQRRHLGAVAYLSGCAY